MLIQCFVDGSSRHQGKDPIGEGSCAVVIYKNGKMIGQYARGLGKCNSVRAEYEAVLMGVLICWAADLKDPILYSDSEMVCKQVNRQWRCKRNSPTRSILLSIWEIAEVFRFRLIQVPRKEVFQADALARMFLDHLESQDEGR